MRALLIDPEAKTITEVEHEGNLESIYKLIRCGCIDAVRIPDHVVYVDDEGLLKSGQSFFALRGYPQVLAGCGLVVGAGTQGEDAAATMSLEELKMNVMFMPDIYTV